jgi:protocatechuate 3,4-dioxygenase beta subunit
MRGFSKLTVVISLLVPLPLLAAMTGTVISTDGKPIAGVRVSAYEQETAAAHIQRLQSKSPDRISISTVQTDSKGNFSIDPQKQAIVDLRFDAPGYAPEGLRVAADEEIGAVALDAAESKKGKITANGKPVVGARVVWLAGGGGLEAMATTAQDGSYSVPDPGVWAGRLLIIHPDYALLEEAFGFMGTRAKLDRTLVAGSALSGRVLAADGQTPVARVKISIDGWPVGESGDDGVFTVPHVSPNWKMVEATADDRAVSHAHDKAAQLTLKLAKGASIRGTVRDAKTQAGLAGVEVRIGITQSAFTDAKGNYALGPMAAGHYQLFASRPLFGGSGTAANVTTGQALDKNVYLTARGRVVGTVIDEDKRPLAGARVSARASNRDPMMAFAARAAQGGRYTGPDGRFVLRGIEPDSDIQVDAVKKGYPPGKSGTMHLAAGERKSGIVITIQQGLAVTGRVLDKDGKPLSGVSITSSESEGGPMAGMRRMVRVAGMRDRRDDQVRTASDGTFTVHLKEGAYDFSFKREGFAVKEVRAVQVNRTSKPLDVTLDPGASVAGKVLRGGAGVEGVDVMVMGESGFQTATTMPDGSFRIDDLTPGPSMINVNKRDDFIQQVRPVTVPNENLVIDLPAGGRISGRVIDKSNKQPIIQFDAGISNSRSGGGMSIMMPPQMKSFSSDDGSFVLENIPPGPVTVVANAPGYASGRVAGLNLEDGKALTDIEVALETGVHLSGRVTGPDGSPLGGVSVRLDTGTAGGARVMRIATGPDSSAVTDPNGEYSFDSLESGDKTFIFSKSGYVSATRTATLSGTDTRLDAQLGAGMHLSGTVITDGGVPVPDASVRTSSASDSTFGRSTAADANGNFQFDGLAPGHYSFSASKSGLTDGHLTDVDITTAGNLRLVMKTGGLIYGHVGGLGASDLQDVTVSVSGSSTNTSASVDSGGNYRIDGAPLGTVRVSAQFGRPFAGDARTTPVKSVEVTAGGSTQVDLDFSSDITLRGRVTRSGQALSSVMVGFFPKSGNARVQTTTDASGTYQASGFEPGTYTVQVFDIQRMSPFTTTYEVKSSGTFDIDEKVASVRGRVLDADTGEPVSEAHVEVKSDDPAGGMLSNRGALTDPNGGFVIDSVVPGNYQVSADKESYGTQVTSLIVGDSSPDDLTIKIARSTGATLKIVDARDLRPLNASARVVDLQGREISKDLFRFDPNGGTIKLNLNPGQYRATVFAQGYAPQTFAVSAPSEQTLGLTPGGSILIRSHNDIAVRARLVQNDQIYLRNQFQVDGAFRVDPKPGTTRIDNVVAGSFTLQLLDPNGNVISSVPITVIEGQIVPVDV